MGKKFNFWSVCIKRAARGSSAFANDWQWLIGYPATAALLWILGYFYAELSGRIEVTLATGALGALAAAFVAYIITWSASFVGRLFDAPVALFYEQKESADKLGIKVNALRAELEQRSPNLIGQLENVIIGQYGESTTCVVSVGIRNIGTPSFVDSWRLFAQNGGNIYPCTITAVSKETPIVLNTVHSEVGSIAFKQEDCINEKTTEPIPTGGQKRGWLFAIVPGIDRESLDTEGTRFTIHFKDVIGKLYSAERTLQKKDTSNPPKWYIPGAGGQGLP